MYNRCGYVETTQEVNSFLPRLDIQFADTLRYVSVVIADRGSNLVMLFLDKSSRSKDVHSPIALMSSKSRNYNISNIETILYTQSYACDYWVLEFHTLLELNCDCWIN